MKITFKTPTTVPAGIALRLTPEQADARTHALEKYGKDDDVVVGTQALQFKAGEVIEVVGDLPKGLLPNYDAIKKAEATELAKGGKAKASTGQGE
jgi:hypothetical protein